MMKAAALVCLTLFAGIPAAEASSVGTRAALQLLLGGPGTLEDFESFNVNTPGTADTLDCAVLNSTAVCNGQGPGLVVPGVEFTFGSGGGQWDDAGYFGAPSKELLSGSPAGQPLTIDFLGGVGAFGLDLRAFTGFAATADVAIYAADDTTLLTTVSGIALADSGIPVFFGWEDAGGIGRVLLTQSGQPWSPLIDNVEFGDPQQTAVPEPASLLLLGSGLAGAALRRKRRRT